MAGKAFVLLDVHMAHLTQYLCSLQHALSNMALELTLQTLLQSPPTVEDNMKFSAFALSIYPLIQHCYFVTILLTNRVHIQTL